MESPANLKNSKNVNFEHFSPRSTRSTHRRAISSHQKFAFVTLLVPASSVFSMDEQRMTTGVRPARLAAAGRRRRAAAARAVAAARSARPQPSDDSTHGSDSGSDSSSGSSPSVGLSGADDDAEEEEPRSAAPGAQRRGIKKPRTGASPPRPFSRCTAPLATRRRRWSALAIRWRAGHYRVDGGCITDAGLAALRLAIHTKRAAFTEMGGALTCVFASRLITRHCTTAFFTSDIHSLT
jgi:hypothetical protein